MAVRKFRRVEDIPDSLKWYDTNDPRLVERIINFYRITTMWHDMPGPRGVHRFRTMAEANAFRKEWDGRVVDEVERRRRVHQEEARMDGDQIGPQGDTGTA